MLSFVVAEALTDLRRATIERLNRVPKYLWREERSERRYPVRISEGLKQMGRSI